MFDEKKDSYSKSNGYQTNYYDVYEDGVEIHTPFGSRYHFFEDEEDKESYTNK